MHFGNEMHQLCDYIQYIFHLIKVIACDFIKTEKIEEELKPLAPKKKADCRPLPISRILADNIKPEKDEYSELKELDMRMHTLKFSQDVAKKCSALNRPDGAPMSLNRYTGHRGITHFKLYII